MQRRDLDALVELSYDAVFDDAAIDRLVAAVNDVNAWGFSAFLFLQTDQRVSDVAVTANVSEEAVRAYTEEYSKIDIMWRARHLFHRPHRISSTDVWDRDDILSDRYYHEFLREKNDVQRVEVVGLSANPGVLGALSCNVSTRLDEESVARVCRILEGLQPHLRRVMRLRRTRLAGEVEAAADLVRCLSTPAALFCMDGTLLDANAAAERILAPAGAEAEGPRTGLPLGDEGLARIVRTFAAGTAPVASTVISDRGGTPVLVHALRRDPERTDALTRLQRVHERLPEPRVLVLLKRAGEVDTEATRLIAESFGLTPAETRLVVLLAEGRSVSGCAALLGISRNTARNQLAGAMAKTGSRGQADLVRLFASGS